MVLYSKYQYVLRNYSREGGERAQKPHGMKVSALFGHSLRCGQSWGGRLERAKTFAQRVVVMLPLVIRTRESSKLSTFKSRSISRRGYSVVKPITLLDLVWTCLRKGNFGVNSGLNASDIYHYQWSASNCFLDVVIWSEVYECREARFLC